MGQANNTPTAEYWHNLQISGKDIQHLSTYLFEKEEPLSLDALVEIIISYRLEEITLNAEMQKQEDAVIYTPGGNYTVGSVLEFPEFDGLQGTVISNREGLNPTVGVFTVTSVQFEDGTSREVASNLPSHPLNQKNYRQEEEAPATVSEIFTKFGIRIKNQLKKTLDGQKEIIRIGASWFPKSLLVDINKGQLNIAEAILDGMEGQPISDDELLKQLEIPVTQDSQKLIQFSLNYALQEDPRFDEVGISGKFSWFLRRFEPENVLSVPVYLRCEQRIDVPLGLTAASEKLIYELDDELVFTNDDFDETLQSNQATITLNYAHWRAGSLPITPDTFAIFPTAMETENIKIDFIDTQNMLHIPAWIVRKHNYVIGLRDWYLEQNLIPGSHIEISATDNPGLISIQPEKKRSNREWIKTVLVGTDGGLVFALLRQAISAGFNDRLAVAISDVDGIDKIWEARANNMPSLKSDINRMMRELAKLNTQQHVHFLDLYAAINIIRRTPPQNLLQALTTNPEFKHVGDHYYHLAESE